MPGAPRNGRCSRGWLPFPMLRRCFKSITRGELRVAVFAMASSLWALTAMVWAKAPIPCGDFVCPYTMGSLVKEPARIYNVDAFHATQVALVPASASLFYPPVYPPQLAVLMAPFSHLPFTMAVTVWALLMVGLYALILHSTYRSLHLRIDAVIFALLAAAFPPFVEMVQYGQNTVLLLGACFLAWRALECERPVLAGAALGLLAIKPQFGIPFAAIVLAGREWRMVAGAACSIAAQATIVWLVMGPAAFTTLAAIIPDIVANADALEPIAARVHSIRSLTHLLPHSLQAPVWIVAVGGILTTVGLVWRSSAPVRVRLGYAILAGVLVSPHLIAYDATLLALPLMWFADWTKNRAEREYQIAVGLLFVTVALPWSALIRVQPSVLVMLWIAHQVWRSVRPSTRQPQRSDEAVDSDDLVALHPLETLVRTGTMRGANQTL